VVGAELIRTPAEGAATLLWLVPALPLLAAVINLFLGKPLGKAAGVLASLAMLVSFGIAALAA